MLHAREQLTRTICINFSPPFLFSRVFRHSVHSTKNRTDYKGTIVAAISPLPSTDRLISSGSAALRKDCGGIKESPDKIVLHRERLFPGGIARVSQFLPISFAGLFDRSETPSLWCIFRFLRQQKRKSVNHKSLQVIDDATPI